MAYQSRLIREVADFTEASLQSNLINGQIGITSDTKRIVGKDEDGDFIKCAALEQNAEFLDVIVDNLFVGEYVKHDLDSDTLIHFQTNQIDVESGGIGFIQVKEDTQSYIAFNQGQVDIDFVVHGNGISNVLFVQGSTGYIGYRESSPLCPLHIYTGNSGYAGALSAGTVICLESEFTNIVQFLGDTSAILQFGDVSGLGHGYIKYTNTGKYLSMQCNSGPILTVYDDGFEIASSASGPAVGTALSVVGTAYQSYFYQSAADGAVPPVIFRQADVDKSFFELSGTSGAAAVGDSGASITPIDAGYGSGYCMAKVKVTDTNAIYTNANMYVMLFVKSE